MGGTVPNCMPLDLSLEELGQGQHLEGPQLPALTQGGNSLSTCYPDSPCLLDCSHGFSPKMFSKGSQNLGSHRRFPANSRQVLRVE